MKGVQEKESIECEGLIEKSVPHDHCLASLGKPPDARQWSSGQIFLSTLTLMINPYTLYYTHEAWTLIRHYDIPDYESNQMMISWAEF